MQVLKGVLSDAASASYEDINKVLAPLLTKVLEKRKRCSVQALLALSRLSLTEAFENILPEGEHAGNLPNCPESNSKAKSLMRRIAETKEIRLSMSPLPEVSLPDPVRHSMVVSYTEYVIHSQMDNVAKRESASGPFLMLLTARALATPNPELLNLYYALLGGFLPRLINEPQLARDLAEELLRAADIDGQRAWGFALSADLYFRQGDPTTGLCYFLMACDCLRKIGCCTFLLGFDLLTSLQRCFRDLKDSELEALVYSFMVDKLKLSGRQLRIAAKVHFDLLIFMQSEQTMEQVIAFLDEHMESILADQEGEVGPWLSVIYSIAIAFGTLSPELARHQERLKAYQGKANLNFEAMIGHDYDGLKKIVRKRSEAHSKTRYQSDLTSELKETATLAERLVALACERHDHEAFALCCHVLLDPSLCHVQLAQPMDLQRLEADSQQLPLPNPLQQMVTRLPGFDLVVIISSFREIFFGSYCSSSEKWTLAQAPKGSNPLFWRLPTAISELLAYESQPVEPSNQQQIAYEDDSDQQSRDYEKARAILEAVRLPLQANRPLAVALSVDISDYPIQLLIDSTGNFIAPTQMMVNLVAPSYVLADKPSETPESSPGKALLWLPAESGDAAIC